MGLRLPAGESRETLTGPKWRWTHQRNRSGELISPGAYWPRSPVPLDSRAAPAGRRRGHAWDITTTREMSSRAPGSARGVIEGWRNPPSDGLLGQAGAVTGAGILSGSDTAREQRLEFVWRQLATEFEAQPPAIGAPRGHLSDTRQ